MINQDQSENSTKQQLALAVRSIDWSYAIFWSLSTAEHGVLEWDEGYYNGHIKTRRTVHAKDVDSQKIGSERSEQLRTLYEALLEGESEQGTKRLSASLSLEDLSDLEWYYLVSMSFTFKVGQSLPGKALATGQHIWLYDAQSADSKVFSRSLLAKSASVQTVICFPHMEGVMELGVIDLVMEDKNLIQKIKTTLLQLTKAICSPEVSSAAHNTDSEKDSRVASINENESVLVDVAPFPKLHPSAEQIMFDEEIGNDLYQSVLEDFYIDSPDDCSNDSCHHAEESVYGCTSSFMPWKKGFTVDNCKLQASQKVLKKVLFTVPLADAYSSTSSSVKEYGMKDYLLRSQDYDAYIVDSASQEATDNVLFSELGEKRENRLYMVHESMLPSTTETDEAFFLANTIEYLAGVVELDTSIGLEGTNTTKDLEILEHTSDIYNKSKAYEIHETEPDLDKAIQMEILQPPDIDMEVSIEEHEVLITLSCPWREYLLIDIMETLNNLNLDIHTIQSSTLDNTLYVFLRSKFQRTSFASEGMIKQALIGTIRMC